MNFGLLGCLRGTFRRLAWPVLRTNISAKHWLLDPYYRGLAVQARYLYRTSDLFRSRWEALGYDYAMESFEGDTGIHFFYKARKEHWWIRSAIFVDATLGREPRPYCMSKEGY